MRKPTRRELAILLKDKRLPARQPSWPEKGIASARITKEDYKGADVFDVHFRDPDKKPDPRRHWRYPNWRHAYATALWVHDKLEADVGKTGHTFDEAADLWLAWCERRVRAKQPTLTLPTFLSYRAAIKHAREGFGSMLLQDIKPRHVRDWIEGQHETYAQRSVLGHICKLKMVLGFAVESEMLASFPLRGMRRLHKLRPERVKVPERTDMEQLRQYLDGPRPYRLHVMHWSAMRVAVVLAASCGLRLGEVCGLTWDAIDPETGELTIHQVVEQTGTVRAHPKTDAGYRKVPTNQRTREILNEHADLYRRHFGQVEGYVVRHYGVHPFTRANTLTAAFPHVMRDAGIVDAGGKPKFTFHALRHWFGAHATKHNRDIHEVKTWMGHANASTTLNTYGFYIDDAEGRARFEAMPDWLSPALPIESLEQPSRPALTYAPAMSESIEAPEIDVDPCPLAIPDGAPPWVEAYVRARTNLAHVVACRAVHKEDQGVRVELAKLGMPNPREIGKLLRYAKIEPIKGKCPVHVPAIAAPWIQPYLGARAQGLSHMDACQAVNRRPRDVTLELRRLRMPSPSDIRARLRAEEIVAMLPDYQDSDIARMVGLQTPQAVTKLRRQRGVPNKSKDKSLKDKDKSRQDPMVETRPAHKNQLKLL